MDDELETLNLEVTRAIFRAERADPGSRSSLDAYRRVSKIEEQIARRTMPDSVEGSFARRGAVSAALRAEDVLRALRLIEEFLVGAPECLAQTLRQLRDTAEKKKGA